MLEFLVTRLEMYNLMHMLSALTQEIKQKKDFMENISQVPSTKSLGVYIDENLTWNVHIENLKETIWAWLKLFVTPKGD